jgi:curved DNA-binding protein
MNPWEVLGVDKTATEDEIKRAYRKLASKHHPDKGGDTATFQNIQTAYDTLTDPVKRQSYSKANTSRDFNFDDLHEAFTSSARFEEFIRKSRWGSQSPRNHDVSAVVHFNLIDFINCATKEVEVRVDGTTQKIFITLTPEYKPGTRLKFPGYGSKQYAGTPSDLYVTVNLLDDGVHQLSGADLYRYLEIDVFKALLGGTEEFTSPDGKLLSIGIPIATKQDTKLRVKGHGLPYGANGLRGDLYVEIIIKLEPLSDDDLNKTVSELYNERHSNRN